MRQESGHANIVASLSGGSERFTLVVLLVGLGIDPPEDIVSPRSRPPAQVSDLLY